MAAAEDRPTEERSEPASTASAAAEPSARTRTRRTSRTDTKTLKKCAACGRSVPARRTRCIWCGAMLPVAAEAAPVEPAPAGSEPGEKTRDEKPASAEKGEASESARLHETAEAALKAATAPAPDPAPPAAETTPSPSTTTATSSPPPTPEAPAPEVTLEALIEAAAAQAPPPAPPQESAPSAPAPPVPSAVETPEKAAAKQAVPPSGPVAAVARGTSERLLAQQATGQKAPAKPSAPEKHGAAAHGSSRGQLVPPQAAASHAPPKDVASSKDLAPIQRDVAHIKASIEHANALQRSFDGKLVLVAKAVEELAKDSQKRRKDYDALYAEMREYKENFVDASQKPLYMDLLLVVDSVLRELRAFEEGAETVPRAAVVKGLGVIKDELLELLYRRDIELIEDHPTKLDVSFQKPVRRLEVQDPALDNTVVQRVREGFRRGDLVLRPQEVVVQRCVGAHQEQEQAATNQEAAGGVGAAPAGTAGSGSGEPAPQ